MERERALGTDLAVPFDFAFRKDHNQLGCWSSPLTAQVGQMTPTKEKEFSW
jgi:hypothetical protein